MKETGFIADYDLEKGTPRDTLHVVISAEGQPVRFNEIVKVSKPGRRVYTAMEDIPVVKSGRGIVIISTSKGLMTGQEAKKARLGGEILVKVW